MRKVLLKIVCYIAVVLMILPLAACSGPQSSGQPSATPTNTPAATASSAPTVTVPVNENVDRDGFNITYGTMVTDGKYLYFRRFGGANQTWDIQRMDLDTKEVKTLVDGTAYDPDDYALYLFLDGGELYFTLETDGGSAEQLYCYDETAKTPTKILKAQTILLAQGILYFVDGGKLYSQPVTGGSNKKLMDKAPLDMAVSPEYAAFLTDKNKVLLAKKDGTTEEFDCSLPEDKGKAEYYWERTYADYYGQIRIYAGALYYIAHVPGPDGNGQVLSLCRLDLAAKTATKLFSVEDNFEMTDFTLFNGKVYYSCVEIPEEQGGQVAYHLYQYDLNTGDNTLVNEKKNPFDGRGNDEYNAITPVGQNVFVWFLTQSTDTGDGGVETYTLYRIDTTINAGEKVTDYQYRFIYE